MNRYIREFIRRGFMWAGGGPLVVAIVYWFLQKNGVMSELAVDEVILAIISSLILAFIAAGISVVHMNERLPKGIAALIQGAVLYADYVIIYLLNGWIEIKTLLLFTKIFVAGYLGIWLVIVLSIRASIRRMNQKLKENSAM